MQIATTVHWFQASTSSLSTDMLRRTRGSWVCRDIPLLMLACTVVAGSRFLLQNCVWMNVHVYTCACVVMCAADYCNTVHSFPTLHIHSNTLTITHTYIHTHHTHTHARTHTHTHTRMHARMHTLTHTMLGPSGTRVYVYGVNV